MLTKVCFKCKQQKSPVDFYKHPMMADGRLGKCKECTKKDVQENYRLRREQYSEYDAKRCQTPERKAQQRATIARARVRSPEKYRARQAVGRAVRSGKLRRMPCEVCGSLRVQAHHHDYSKPLDVHWMCWRCHNDEHGKVTTRDTTAVGIAQPIEDAEAAE